MAEEHRHKENSELEEPLRARELDELGSNC